MSEDPNTPVLRLKPRARLDAPADGAPPVNAATLPLPPPAAPVAPMADASVAAPVGALKLKPRAPSAPSGVDTPAIAAPPPAAPAVSAVPPTVAVPPVTPAISSTPPPSAPFTEPAAEGALPSFKLRPRAVTPPSDASPAGALPPMPAAAAVTPPPLPVSPAVPEVPVAPAAAAATPKPDAQDAARFKLKPRLGPSDAAGVPKTAPAPALPPMAPVPAMAVSSAPPPAMPAAAILPPVAAPVLPPVFPAVAPKTAAVPPLVAAAPSLGKPVSVKTPENSPAFKIGLWVAGGLLVVVIGVGGFLGFRVLMKKEPHGAPMFVTKPSPAKKAEPAAAESAPASAPAPKDVVVASPQSMPGKMVGKARDVVAAREKSGQVSGVEEVLSDSPTPPTAPTSAPVRAAATETKSVAASTPAAPVPVEVSAPAKPAAPPPSLAFRTFVGNLRVNGVFQGEPGRALLNGRMVGVGDMADPQQGIRFIQIDSTRKLLIFEDKAGSTVQRRY